MNGIIESAFVILIVWRPVPLLAGNVRPWMVVPLSQIYVLLSTATEVISTQLCPHCVICWSSHNDSVLEDLGILPTRMHWRVTRTGWTSSSASWSLWACGRPCSSALLWADTTRCRSSSSTVRCSTATFPSLPSEHGTTLRSNTKTFRWVHCPDASTMSR